MFVIGHKTPNRREIGEILYYGADADEANKAVADNAEKFPRIDQSLPGIEGFFRTVQHYDENHPAVAKPQVSDEKADEVKKTKSKK